MRMLRIVDYAERTIVVLLSLPFLIAFVRVMPAHPHVIVLAASELIAVMLVLIRKPGAVAATPYAFLIALLGTAAPLLIRPTGGIALATPTVTLIIMTAGALLSVGAKLFLNRSFGIVAANRGVKQGGPYSLVRHPMYLGYIITQAGFLLAVFSPLNVAMYAIAWTFQILRILEEEKFLRTDDAYVSFSRSTRWRLVPGLF
jgi:protein-S-isoprenylcysteine O-methyltransferase Ste14